MSPTSYQTAPPRTLMITNAVGAVKRVRCRILPALFHPRVVQGLARNLRLYRDRLFGSILLQPTQIRFHRISWDCEIYAKIRRSLCRRGTVLAAKPSMH